MATLQAARDHGDKTITVTPGPFGIGNKPKTRGTLRALGLRQDR